MKKQTKNPKRGKVAKIPKPVKAWLRDNQIDSLNRGSLAVIDGKRPGRKYHKHYTGVLIIDRRYFKAVPITPKRKQKAGNNQ